MKKFYGGLLLALILIVGLTIPTNTTEAASKKVSLKISNGGTYYGEVKNGKPHGKGTAKWGDTKTYSGEWANGKRSGQGKMVYRDVEYTYYEDGGYRIDVSKHVYNGNWKNDIKNGQGVYTETSSSNEGTGDPVITIQKGIFKNNIFIEGYYLGDGHDKNHMSLLYKNSKKTLEMHIMYGDDSFFDGIDKALKDNNQIISYTVLNSAGQGRIYEANSGVTTDSKGYSLVYPKGFDIYNNENYKLIKSTNDENERMQIVKKMRTEFLPHAKGLEFVYDLYLDLLIASENEIVRS